MQRNTREFIDKARRAAKRLPSCVDWRGHATRAGNSLDRGARTAADLSRALRLKAVKRLQSYTHPEMKPAQRSNHWRRPASPAQRAIREFKREFRTLIHQCIAGITRLPGRCAPAARWFVARLLKFVRTITVFLSAIPGKLRSLVRPGPGPRPRSRPQRVRRRRAPLTRAVLARRRRQIIMVASVTLGTGLLVGLIIAAAAVRSHEDAMLRGSTANAATAAVGAKGNSDMESLGLDEKLARTEDTVKAYREAATQSVGDEAGVMQVMSDWLDLQHRRLSDYQMALRKFMVAGSIDAQSLTSKEEIGFRLALAEDLRRASVALTGVFSEGVDTLEDAMTDRGVSPSRAEEEVARLRDRNEWPIAMELRRMDERAMGLFVRYLSLLRETFGLWTIEPTTGDVNFNDKVAPGTVADFNELTGEIRRIGRQQTELKAQLPQ